MTSWQDNDPTRPRPPVPPRRRPAAPDADPTLPPRPQPALSWAAPPPPPAGTTPPGGPPTTPGAGSPTAGWSGPPPHRPGRASARGRHTTGVLVAVLAVAVALGGAIAWGAGNASSLFPSSTVRSGAKAQPVSQAKANPSAIAGEADPGIVDVISTLSLQNGEAAGTGMVLTPNGEILTNNHVVDESTSLSVKISNGSKAYPAKVIGTDPTDDIAVIQAEGASGLTPLTFGDSSGVSVGDSVVAIGNALNKPGPPAVTDGSVIALDRSITVNSDLGGTESLSNLIEHNAGLQPGNSGGPLFNAAGQVIGMNTAAASGNIPQGGTNDGFAIPIDDALNIAKQIETGKSGGNVTVGPRGFLGVEVGSGSSGSGGSGSGGGFGNGGFGGRFGGGFGNGGGGFDNGSGGSSSGSDQGVVVQGVVPNTPAAQIGLEQGDTILSVDGQTVSSNSDMTQIIGAKHPGDRITLTWVDSSGDQHTATVQLSTNPAAN